MADVVGGDQVEQVFGDRQVLVAHPGAAPIWRMNSGVLKYTHASVIWRLERAYVTHMWTLMSLPVPATPPNSPMWRPTTRPATAAELSSSSRMTFTGIA